MKPGCIEPARISQPIASSVKGRRSSARAKLTSGPAMAMREFLPWVFGQPLQIRYAADGQQRDVAHADAIVSGDQGVPEFMQRDAGEEQYDGDHAVDRPSRGVGAAAL